ncbi:MAG: hypothetical protein AAF456_16835, partial [Planctomycetota bacterium]
MALQIGTDEAGYGPNLGPLTVTASTWSVPEIDCDLFKALESAVSARSADTNRLVIADSKAVYSSTGSIANLETTVLAALLLVYGKIPSSWQELAGVLDATSVSGGVPDDEIWLAGRKLTLPVKADPENIRHLAERLKVCLSDSGIELNGLLCRAVFPDEFNTGIDSHGNKASLLSSVTLQLVAEQLRSYAAGLSCPVSICCDKHGGRSKYASLLQEHLTESLVMVECESLEESRYRWNDGNTSFQAKFIAKGESSLPVA